MSELFFGLQITSPFHMFSPANAFALGIALVALSFSIIVTNLLTPTSDRSKEQRVVLAFSLAAITFFGIRSSVTLQKLFSYFALVLVVLFPIVVGYVAFRELVLQGVFYNQ